MSKEKDKKDDPRASVPPPHHEVRTAAAIAGTAAGAVLGSIAGPPGAIAGAAIGAAMGAAAGQVLETEDERGVTRDHELDDEIGVTSGSMGLDPDVPRTAEEAASRRTARESEPPRGEER